MDHIAEKKSEEEEKEEVTDEKGLHSAASCDAEDLFFSSHGISTASAAAAAAAAAAVGLTNPPTANNTGLSRAQVRELKAIAKELDESDRIKKDGSRKRQGASASASRNASVKVGEADNTNTTTNTTTTTSQLPALPPGVTEALKGQDIRKEAPALPLSQRQPVGKHLQQQQLQQQRTSHVEKRQSLSEKFAYNSNNTNSVENAHTESMLKERDIGVPGTGDEEDAINPVLMRHLAESLPGAIQISRRPPNLAVPGAYYEGGDGIVDVDNMPTTPVRTRNGNGNGSRNNAALSREHSTSSSLTTPASITIRGINGAPGSPLLDMPATNVHMSTSHLLIASPVLPRLGGNTNNGDIEQPTTGSMHDRSARSQARRGQSAAHMDSNDALEDDDDDDEQTPPPVVVAAEDAKLTDFLQNRTFCLFLVGYLCAILTIVALIVVIVVMQGQQTNTTVDPLETSEKDLALFETAQDLLTSYMDQTNNPAQLRAYTWLNQHPDLQELPSWRRVQLYAMVTFYYAFNGDNWDFFPRDSWRTTGNECYWGEQYSNEGGEKSACRVGGKITQLQLIGGEDSILVNEEIEKLTSVNLIDSEIVEVANVIGAMPDEVAFLTSLETIHVGYTVLDAPLQDMIPAQLALLKNLTLLDYGYNSLRGTIPQVVAQLTTLQYLSLKSNALTGTIPPELGTLPNLRQLNLERNQLSGEIPPALGSLSASLTDLSLRNNNLRGQIPTDLGNLVELQSLRLQANGLTGTIPSQLASLTQLSSLQLWRTKLSGSIPSELGLLSPSLTFLDLQETDLTGTLPRELGLLTNLERLLMFGTSIQGDIPTALCNSKRLTKFEVNCSNVNCPQECSCRCYAF